MNNQKIKEKAKSFKNDVISKTSMYFDGKKDKELAEAVTKFAIKGVFSSIYSFLIASTMWLFGTYPLGISLLCASSKNIAFIYIGCSAAALYIETDLSLIHLLIYTLCLLMRFAVWKWIYDTPSPFTEAIPVRSIIGLICGFASGVYFCIVDKFSLYSLGALVFTCAVTLGLTAILSGTTEKSHHLHRQAAYCALGFCLISALSKYSVFGFSIAFASCTCICLYSAMTNDMFQSTIFSLVCGFACNRPALAPMFALMALFCSLTRKFKEKAALSAGIFAGVAYAFWVYGLTAITYVIPDIICGAIISIPAKFLSSYSLSSINNEEKQEGDNPINTELQKQLGNARKQDAQTMALALESLSSTLNELANKLKKPDISKLKEISSESYRTVCSKCKLNSVCSISYTNNKSANGVFTAQTSNALFDKGYVSWDDLPSRFSSGCQNTKDIIYHLNNEYGMLLKKLSTEDKNKAFSSGYSAVSKLINEGELRHEEEYTIDPALTQSSMGLCRELNLSPSTVYVYGKRKKQVVIKGKGTLAISGGKLKEAFSNLCQAPLTDPFTESIENNWKIHMEGIPIIDVEVGFSTQNCLGEDVCGDHVCSFKSNDGYCYSVLSDGMGSGRQADLVSTICCTFAEKLSLCGGSLKTVLEAINNYVINQSYECSATLDLLRIDQYSGIGCFVKSGAVSSMVIRGGHVFRISSATVPIGVVRELNSEQITLPLKAGDLIIMTSDGVSPDFESGLLIADIAIKNQDLSAKEISERIIASAAPELKRPDDMSCAIIKITGYNEKKI